MNLENLLTATLENLYEVCKLIHETSDQKEKESIAASFAISLVSQQLIMENFINYIDDPKKLEIMIKILREELDASKNTIRFSGSDKPQA